MFLGLLTFQGGHALLHGSEHFAFHGIWLLMLLLPFAFVRRGQAAAQAADGDAPITLAEADALGAGSEPLTAHFCALLRSVTEAQGLSASAQHDVREALRDIGDLTAKLSADPAAGVSNDPAAIQRQAEETEEQARLESDSVVAASLRRQAETLRGSAILASQRSTLRRRREAARGEVLTQIQSMQVTLESHMLSGQNEESDFAGLSASIQHIAAEVNAALSAREEVRSAVEPRYQEPPPNTQTLGQ